MNCVTISKVVDGRFKNISALVGTARNFRGLSSAVLLSSASINYSLLEGCKPIVEAEVRMARGRMPRGQSAKWPKWLVNEIQGRIDKSQTR